MGKQKVTLSVRETLFHKITIELEPDEIRRLRECSEDLAAEIIGDYMSHSTIQSGLYEDPEID